MEKLKELLKEIAKEGYAVKVEGHAALFDRNGDLLNRLTESNAYRGGLWLEGDIEEIKDVLESFVEEIAGDLDGEIKINRAYREVESFTVDLDAYLLKENGEEDNGTLRQTLADMLIGFGIDHRVERY